MDTKQDTIADKSKLNKNLPLKEQAYQKANNDRASQFATIAGASGAVLGGEKILQKALKKKISDNSKDLSNASVNRFINDDQKIDPSVTERGIKLRTASNYASLAKGVSRLGLAAGIGGYLLDKGTKKIDPSGEGIFDRKYTEGDRDKYLAVAGLSAAIPAFLGQTYLSGKAKKALLVDEASNNPRKLMEQFEAKEEKMIDPKIRKTTISLEKMLNSETPEEYLKQRKHLAEHGKEDVKQAISDAGLTKKDYRLLNTVTGVERAGATAAGIGITGLAGASDYKNNLRELEEEQLKKKASFGLAAGMHLGQAQLYKAIAEGKIGKKQAAKYLTNRFTEGYTGEAVKPKGTNRLIPEKARSFLHGAAKQIMPEADIVGKEATALGKRIKDSGIVLEDLTSQDKKFLKEIAKGDLVSAAKTGQSSPAAQDILHIAMPNLRKQHTAAILGEASLKTNTPLLKSLSEQFKKTRTQPILESISKHVEKQGLPKTKGSIKDTENIRNTGYNVGHAGLAVLDPTTAALNAVKRYATGEKMPETQNSTLNIIPKTYNGVQKALQVVTSTIPTVKAKAKGLSGKDYNPSTSDKVLKEVWSPAIEHTKEDSQRFAKMQRDILLDESVSGNKGHSNLGDMQNKLNKAVDEYGSIKGVHKAVKAVNQKRKLLPDNDKNNLVNALKGSMKMRSKDATRRQEGEKQLHQAMQQGTVDHKSTVEKAVNKAIGKADEQSVRAAEEVGKLEERYSRWVAPSATITATAIASPAIMDLHERRQQANNTKPKSKLNTTKAA